MQKRHTGEQFVNFMSQTIADYTMQLEIPTFQVFKTTIANTR